MAIQLEVIIFIVPISIIKTKYPGGWSQCIEDHKRLIGGRVWYDDHLFRDGAMNQMDIRSLVDEWQAMGFDTYAGGHEPTRWIDVCVIDFFGPTLSCDWVEYDGVSAWLKGKPPEPTIGRNAFPIPDPWRTRQSIQAGPDKPHD